MYLASPKLLKIYITDSPDAIAEGILRLSFVCLPYFLCGLMDVMTGILRGMGSSVGAHGHYGGRCLRNENCVDIYHLPNPCLPYCLLPVYILSYLLDTDLYCRVYRLPCNFQKGKG